MNYNHISDRQVLEIRGSDRISFLQGLVTADLSDLKQGKMTLSALLSPQGKIRYLFYIFYTDDSLYLECSNQQALALSRQLTLFKLRADIQISLSDLYVYSGDHKASPPSETLITAIDNSLPMTGWRALSQTPPALPGDGDTSWLKRRILAGVPEICDIQPDKTIALEANLDALGAVSWTKGCYLGQEVTARSFYRGLVKKRLAPVILEGESFFEKNGCITVRDYPSIPLLSHYENLALIMLPRALWTNPALKYGDKTVLIHLPEPFTKAFSSEGPLS